MFDIRSGIDLVQRPGGRRWPAIGTGAVALIGLALALLLLIGSSSSTAEHPALSRLSLTGSAVPSGKLASCGTAVDGEGNVYAADPSNSQIDIFSAAGRYLGAVSNLHRPCGVAVDSKGDIYVLERGKGTVVRYRPVHYPFSGPPRYGAPATIDSSGHARGLAVDPFDNHLYVAEDGVVDVYNPNGTLGQDEAQHVYPFEATGGTYTLRFESKETGWIPYNATHAKVQAYLERVITIGKGNVAVKRGPNGHKDQLIIFKGKLANKNVGTIEGNGTTLTGSKYMKLLVGEVLQGFSGRIGAGLLAEASGVAAYTYGATTPSTYGGGATHYLFVADSAGAAPDRIYVFSGSSAETLEERTVITGSSTPAGSIGFGSGGAGMGVDPKTGHLYVYDAAHSVIDEFRSDGEYVGQIPYRSSSAAQPAGIAVDRSGGPRDGTIYASGGSAGSVSAFGPATAPTHPRIAGLGGKFKDACGIAVDSYGNIYVAGGTKIVVYSPSGSELTHIREPRRPCDLAVDSEGNVYAITRPIPTEEFKEFEEVRLYRPSSYPPSLHTVYSAPEVIFSQSGAERRVAVDPATNHLLVNRFTNVASSAFRVVELNSAHDGSALISNEQIGAGVLKGAESFHGGLDVCAKNGDIFVGGAGEAGWRIYVLDRTGTKLLTAIDGSGSNRGPLLEHSLNIAVDQSNCHVYVVDFKRRVEEYDPTGGFVTEFGPQTVLGDVAVDNGPYSPNRGNVYVISWGREWLGFGPATG